MKISNEKGITLIALILIVVIIIILGVIFFITLKTPSEEIIENNIESNNYEEENISDVFNTEVSNTEAIINTMATNTESTDSLNTLIDETTNFTNEDGIQVINSRVMDDSISSEQITSLNGDFVTLEAGDGTINFKDDGTVSDSGNTTECTGTYTIENNILTCHFTKIIIWDMDSEITTKTEEDINKESVYKVINKNKIIATKEFDKIYDEEVTYYRYDAIK